MYLQQRYGFNVGSYRSANRTAPKFKHDIDDETLGMLRERMKPELELYRLASQLLGARLQTVENLSTKVRGVSDLNPALEPPPAAS